MLSLEDALAAVKADDLGLLKQFVRESIAAANGVGGTEEDIQRRITAFLSVPEPTKKRSTLLHWAAYLGNVDAVRLLAHYGADINAQEVDGKTPLHWAAFEGHAAICEFLVHDRGADSELKDLLGNTPCHMALLKQNHQVARIFPNYRSVIVSEDELSAQDVGGCFRSSTRRSLASLSAGGSRTNSPVTRGISPDRLGALPLSSSMELPRYSSAGAAPRHASASSTTSSSSSTSADPTPMPFLSVRPVGKLAEATVRRRGDERRADEERKKRDAHARKEAKKEQLIEQLLAKFAAEDAMATPSTPLRPIFWAPRPAAEVSQYSRQSSVSARTASRSQRAPSPVAAAANLSMPITHLPDASLYRRSTPPRNTNTPTRMRPMWRPPSSVPLDSPRADGRRTTRPVIDKLDVRSY